MVKSQCVCSVCRHVALSVPEGTQHRRCPGSPAPEGQEVTIRPKRNKLPSSARGVWQ